MNVDEKSLAAEMFKKMNLPVPQVDGVPSQKPSQATKKLEVSESESSDSEQSSDEDEEEEKSKFQAVQRYKNQKPLTLRPD